MESTPFTHSNWPSAAWAPTWSASIGAVRASVKELRGQESPPSITESLLRGLNGMRGFAAAQGAAGMADATQQVRESRPSKPGGDGGRDGGGEEGTRLTDGDREGI